MVGRFSGTLLIRVQILVLATFPGILPRLTGVVREVVSIVPVDNEVSLVTSGISKSVGCSVLQRCS
jgi:hypothetical protein